MADQIVSAYREAKLDMESIISQRLNEAFEEIQQKYGITPIDLDVEVIDEVNTNDIYRNGMIGRVEIAIDGI
ncbi:hypothetical protein [Phytohalomonas tamaricis]|uniref:hypothetical protein n=1 Tax=Phytohalomonas tamaricis TaxID=2081032 RepID=UPI000D0BE1E0|nr:hypothetical protein [Phytohalomonas tamaricis]